MEVKLGRPPLLLALFKTLEFAWKVSQVVNCSQNAFFGVFKSEGNEWKWKNLRDKSKSVGGWSPIFLFFNRSAFLIRCSLSCRRHSEERRQSSCSSAKLSYSVPSSQVTFSFIFLLYKRGKKGSFGRFWRGLFSSRTVRVISWGALCASEGGSRAPLIVGLRSQFATILCCQTSEKNTLKRCTYCSFQMQPCFTWCYFWVFHHMKLRED